MADERDLEAEVTEEEPAEFPEPESAGESDSEELVEDTSQDLDETEEKEPPDELDALHQELEEARGKESEYLEGWQRARAELANARKRFDREQKHAYSNAKASLFAYLLPMVDDFERAFDTVPDDLSEENWVEGIKLILHKFQRLLEQEGVETMETTGKEFDPYLHEAISFEPNEAVPERHIIAEMQKGYRMGERVLRPSVVRVSSGPPPTLELEDDDTAADETPAVDDASSMNGE